MKRIILEKLSLYSGVFGVLGIIFYLLSERDAVIIALFVLCFSLIALLIKVFLTLDRVVKNEHPTGYQKKSSFVKYEAVSQHHIVFETFRLIQCKLPTMDQFEYKYKWTGKIQPKISSRLQEVANMQYNSNNSYDKAILKFKSPLLFNDTAVVHFLAEMDDPDLISKPHIEFKIESETDFVHFRVILRYKPTGWQEPAVLSKRPINSELSTEFENIRTIQFDPDTKSYEDYFITPKPGYFYRVTWTR